MLDKVIYALSLIVALLAGLLLGVYVFPPMHAGSPSSQQPNQQQPISPQPSQKPEENGAPNVEAYFSIIKLPVEDKVYLSGYMRNVGCKNASKCVVLIRHEIPFKVDLGSLAVGLSRNIFMEIKRPAISFDKEVYDATIEAYASDGSKFTSNITILCSLSKRLIGLISILNAGLDVFEENGGGIPALLSLTLRNTGTKGVVMVQAFIEPLETSFTFNFDENLGRPLMPNETYHLTWPIPKGLLNGTLEPGKIYEIRVKATFIDETEFTCIIMVECIYQ